MSKLEPLESRMYLAFPVVVGAAGVNSGHEVARLPGGDVIVAGMFAGTVSFNPVTERPQTGVLTSEGDTDIFIARYTPDGALVWARRFGGIEGEVKFNERANRPLDIALRPQRAGGIFVNGVGPDVGNAGEYVNGIAVAPDESIYVVGGFRAVASFGGGAFNMPNLLTTNRDFHDIFVLKLTADGTLTWANQFGGRFTDIAMDVALDPLGNPYVVGQFTRTADFNPHPTATFNVDALGRADAFTMKLSVNGKLIWVAPMGSEAIRRDLVESANAIAVDAVGNAYITGTFTGTADFNPTPGRGNELYVRSIGQTDAFTALLSTRGKLVWVRTQGGDDFDGGRAITLVGDPNAPDVVTAGYFEGIADVDPGPAQSFMIATPEAGGGSSRYTDLVVTQLVNNGDVRWFSQVGGPLFETIGGLTVDAQDNIYLSGAFNGQITVGEGSATRTLASARLPQEYRDSNERGGDRRESYDGFLLGFNASGTARFATRFGSNDDEFAIGSIGPTSGGSEMFVVGRFSRVTLLEPAGTLTTTAKSAIFVQRLGLVDFDV